MEIWMTLELYIYIYKYITLRPEWLQLAKKTWMVTDWIYTIM